MAPMIVVGASDERLFRRATLPGSRLLMGGRAAGCSGLPRHSDFWPPGGQAVAEWAWRVLDRRWPAPPRHAARAGARHPRRTRARPARPAQTAAAARHRGLAPTLRQPAP